MSTLKNLDAPVLIDWREVTMALQDRNCDIIFYELTDLIHAGLALLQRSINAEAYEVIQRRKARSGGGKVSMRVIEPPHNADR